jgi:hypothetical protein
VSAPDRPGDGPWDLAFLRVGLLVSGVGAALGAVVAGLLGGWTDVAGVLLGALVVTGFFCVSGVVVAWAGRIDDSYTLPAALGTFLVKMLVLVAVIQAVPVDGWVDRRVLGWTVVAGALLWSVVQMRWVWARQLYYVTPPTAPSPAAPPVAPTAPEVSAGDTTGGPPVTPPADPGSRTTRG